MKYDETSTFFIDEWDKSLSTRIHMMKLPQVLEYALAVFGYLFNRGLCVVSFAISAFMAGYYPQEITTRMAKSVPEGSAILVYLAFNIIQLVILLLITQSLKHLLRR